MFKQKPNSHLSNTYGCPKCGEENSCGYSREDYIKKCGESNSKLYLVKFEKDKEVFYKIGITKQAINKRFKRSKLPYYYELIKYVEGNASYIFDLEKIIHKELKEYKYSPNHSFPGHTECFIFCNNVLDVFNEI